MQTITAAGRERRAPGPQRSAESTSPPSAAGEQPLRLLLVDDHPLLRAGLRALLSAEPGFEVVAETDSGESALLLARTLGPDLVVLDFSLPGMSGADTARSLKSDDPSTRVLALSVHEELAIVHRFLDSGADGYVLKRSASSELVHAVREIAAGARYLDPALPQQATAGAGHSLRRSSPSGIRVQLLSEREAEVSRLLAQGLTMKEIAQQLNVSPRTLETYRARAMEKLGLKSRADLIRYALKRGWLNED